MTIELRADDLRVAGFDNRRSEPNVEPSASHVRLDARLSELFSTFSGNELESLPVLYQLKSVKSLRKVLRTDMYEREPKDNVELARLIVENLSRTDDRLLKLEKVSSISFSSAYRGSRE